MAAMNRSMASSQLPLRCFSRSSFRPVRLANGLCAARCREARQEISSLQLKEPHRLGQASQAVIAERAEGSVDGSRGLDGSYGVSREQNLAAVARRADAGGRMHGQAYVAAIGQRRTAGMDADSDPDCDAGRPNPRADLLLDGQCCSKRGRRLLEDSE